MRLTASRLPLAEHCLYPFRDGVAWDTRPAGAAAQVGSWVGALLTYLINTPVVRPAMVATLGNTDRAKAHRIAANVGNWWKAWRQELQAFCSEPAYAYDPNTGASRPIGLDVGRNYDAEPHELTGASDILAVDNAGTLWMLDLKTGRTPPEQYRPQVHGLALMAARTLGATSVKCGVLHADESRAEMAWTDDLDDMDLSGIAHDIGDKASRIPKALPVYGEHCDKNWCPARISCPAYLRSKGAA